MKEIKATNPLELNENTAVTESTCTEEELNRVEALEQNIRSGFFKQFNPTTGMKKIMLGIPVVKTTMDENGVEQKILTPSGGAFYAARIQDSVTKKSEIGIVIQYPDGTYSEMIQFKQSLLVTALKRINTNNYPKMYDYIVKAKELANLREYATPEMPVPVVTLILLIREMKKDLPVRSIQNEASIEDIYTTIVLNVLSNEDKKECSYFHKDGYYNLTSNDVREIAEMYGLKPRELVKKLDLHNLLRKDNDSRFQYSMRTEFGLKKLYSIKEFNLDVDSETDSEDKYSSDEDALPYMTEYISGKGRHKYAENNLYKLFGLENPNVHRPASLEEEFQAVLNWDNKEESVPNVPDLSGMPIPDINELEKASNERNETV